ncbi:hypothetical protein B0H13DRAFT_1891632 [Mycena leptocephala]|nr:hypothetical protein B0H13DRAFT_1891632 [Mycena leptocephala]
MVTAKCQGIKSCCDVVFATADSQKLGLNCSPGGIDCGISGQVTACCESIQRLTKGSGESLGSVGESNENLPEVETEYYDPFCSPTSDTLTRGLSERNRNMCRPGDGGATSSGSVPRRIDIETAVWFGR